jgi:hypothetical protein
MVVQLIARRSALYREGSARRTTRRAMRMCIAFSNAPAFLSRDFVRIQLRNAREVIRIRPKVGLCRLAPRSANVRSSFLAGIRRPSDCRTLK